MFNPNTYTQWPDHYSEQQIKQSSDISVSANSVQMGSLRRLNPGESPLISFLPVDICDENYSVRMRVIPNGNYIWEESSAVNKYGRSTVYQVDGVPGSACELELGMMDYNYCNKEISVKISSYNGTWGYAENREEMIIRQPNNIWHFDAFSGPKMTVWPTSYLVAGETSLLFSLMSYHDELVETELSQGYEYWLNLHWGPFADQLTHDYYASQHSAEEFNNLLDFNTFLQTYIDAGYNLDWPVPNNYVSFFWTAQETNADHNHTIDMAELFPLDLRLGSSTENLNGISDLAVFDFSPTYLSPFVLNLFPDGTIIDFSSPMWIDVSRNPFDTSTGYGILSDINYLEYVTGLKVSGALFDGYGFIIRPYFFSYAGLSWESIFNENGVNQGENYYMMPMGLVVLPPDYEYWPWSAIETGISFPFWPTYDMEDGDFNTWMGNVPKGYASSFSNLKANVYETQSLPTIETYSGNFVRYTWRNVILSYGKRSYHNPSPGMFLEWHSRGVVVDIVVDFKRKPFPDICTIPGIQDVRKLSAQIYNVRELNYRDISYKTNNYANAVYEGWLAYRDFGSQDEEKIWITPYKDLYPSYVPPAPIPGQPYYIDGAFFEYPLVATWFNITEPFFMYYDPKYEFLYEPVYTGRGPFPPIILTGGASGRQAIGNGFYEPISHTDSTNTLSGSAVYNENFGNGKAELQIFLGSQSPVLLYGCVETVSSSVPIVSDLYCKIYIRTNSKEGSELLDVYPMEDRGGIPGFGNGWMQMEVIGDLTVYDPDGNELVNREPPHPAQYAYNTPTHDKDISPYYYGNYAFDYTRPLAYGGGVNVYWFYTSAKSYNPIESGIPSGEKTYQEIRPFGSYFGGIENNTDFCRDGIYLLTESIIGGPIYSDSFQTYDDGFQPLKNPKMEIVFGAFIVDSSNDSFNVSPVPLYFVPGLDMSKPYSGCINANISASFGDRGLLISKVYVPELEGKMEVNFAYDWWDNIESLVEVHGPGDIKLEHGVDYFIERIPFPSRPGNFKVVFLKTLGECYENEQTGNPPWLSDGEYSFYLPRRDFGSYLGENPQDSHTALSIVDNYSASIDTNIFPDYFPYYFSEFYEINGEYSQFYIGSSYYYSHRHGSGASMAHSETTSISPIVFELKGVLFSNRFDITNPNEWSAFKCDIQFTEILDENEFPVNPPGFNALLDGALEVEGGWNY